MSDESEAGIPVYEHDEDPLVYSVWPFGSSAKAPFVAVMTVRDERNRIAQAIVRVPAVELKSTEEASLFIRAVSIASLMAQDIVEGASNVRESLRSSNGEQRDTV